MADGCLDSDHDEEDEVDEKKRKVSKVWECDIKFQYLISVQILQNLRNEIIVWNIKVKVSIFTTSAIGHYNTKWFYCLYCEKMKQHLLLKHYI